MNMEKRRTYHPAARPKPARGAGGARLAVCLVLAAAAMAGRLYFPEGVARVSDVVFGTRDSAVRQVFAGFTEDLAERGAAEAFSALYGKLAGNAAD